MIDLEKKETIARILAATSILANTDNEHVANHRQFHKHRLR